MDEKLKKDFEEFISRSDINENDVQEYLEKNTELIPKKFMENHGISENIIISKLPIGLKYITDFAFVSKCTIYWNIVLIEIEDPKKKMFTQADDFSADFTKAKGQIDNWKSLLNYDSNAKESLECSLKTLIVPERMRDNPINIKYVLVYGRSSEINNDIRKKKFAQLNDSSDVAVVTYDSLKNRWENTKLGNCMIANIVSGDKLSLKIVPDENFDTGIFSEIHPTKLEINNAQKNIFKKYGYQIDEWEKGYMLYVNCRLSEATGAMGNVLGKRKFD